MSIYISSSGMAVYRCEGVYILWLDAKTIVYECDGANLLFKSCNAF